MHLVFWSHKLHSAEQSNRGLGGQQPVQELLTHRYSYNKVIRTIPLHYEKGLYASLCLYPANRKCTVTTAATKSKDKSSLGFFPKELVPAKYNPTGFGPWGALGKHECLMQPLGAAAEQAGPYGQGYRREPGPSAQHPHPPPDKELLRARVSRRIVVLKEATLRYKASAVSCFYPYGCCMSRAVLGYCLYPG